MKEHVSTTGVKPLSRQKVKLMTYTAVFAALITVMTAYICHIPTGINGGYIHFGDSLIYIAAAMLPTPYAIVAASIGGGLADLLTSPMWAIPTIIIKALITLPFTRKNSKIVCTHNVIALFVAFVISSVGYFLADSFFMGGFGGGLIAYAIGGGSWIQSGGSAIIFVILGLFLDKIGFKRRFLKEEYHG